MVCSTHKESISKIAARGRHVSQAVAMVTVINTGVLWSSEWFLVAQPAFRCSATIITATVWLKV